MAKLRLTAERTTSPSDTADAEPTNVARCSSVEWSTGPLGAEGMAVPARPIATPPDARASPSAVQVRIAGAWSGRSGMSDEPDPTGSIWRTMDRASSSMGALHSDVPPARNADAPPVEPSVLGQVT